MTQNKLADPSDTEIAHSAKKTTTAKQNVAGIRIRRIPESKNDKTRCRQGHNLNEVQKVLHYNNFEAAKSNVTQLGKHTTNKTGTIFLKVANPQQTRMNFVSTRILQSSGRTDFLIQKQSKEMQTARSWLSTGDANCYSKVQTP